MRRPSAALRGAPAARRAHRPSAPRLRRGAAKVGDAGLPRVRQERRADPPLPPLVDLRVHRRGPRPRGSRARHARRRRQCDETGEGASQNRPPDSTRLPAIGRAEPLEGRRPRARDHAALGLEDAQRVRPLPIVAEWEPADGLARFPPAPPAGNARMIRRSGAKGGQW